MTMTTQAFYWFVVLELLVLIILVLMGRLRP